MFRTAWSCVRWRFSVSSEIDYYRTGNGLNIEIGRWLTWVAIALAWALALALTLALAFTLTLALSLAKRLMLRSSFKKLEHVD